MNQKRMSKEEALQLAQRDEHEDDEFGQHLRSTFHLADVFVRVSPRGEPEGIELKRFYRLLFGESIITPTIDEYGMFLADAAALRSAQLARQVGASIVSIQRDVVSLGANEVPASGGGQYWENQEGDARDHIRGVDPTDEIRREMQDEIGEALMPGWETGGEEVRAEARRKLSGTRVGSLTEFGRAVHAEMDAILSAQRMGRSVVGSHLYTTTFPCHNCAKHIVAAGVSRVIYVEPYPKSQAFRLHGDAIIVEGVTRSRASTLPVEFVPFVGIAPRRFSELFSIVSQTGILNRRKDEAGIPTSVQKGSKLRSNTFGYRELEAFAGRQLDQIVPKPGSQPSSQTPSKLGDPSK